MMSSPGIEHLSADEFEQLKQQGNRQGVPMLQEIECLALPMLQTFYKKLKKLY